MVSQAELATNYKIVPSSLRLSMSTIPSTSFNAGDGLWAATAVIGINGAFFVQNKWPKDALYIQQSPGQKVITRKSIGVDDAVFVPWAQTVKTAKEPIDNPLVVVVWNQSRNVLASFNIDRPDMKVPAYNEIVFWKLRRVHDKACSTMQISTIEVNVPLPKIQKNMDKQVNVRVPIAIPSKAVAHGDELVLYIPAAKKSNVASSSLAVCSEPVPKKPRH